MISAFGVDHGGISKGLPSALRKPVSQGAQGWEANAMIHRRNANFMGREAAKNFADSAKAPGSLATGGTPKAEHHKLGNNKHYYGLRSKNDYKASLQKITDGKRRKPKRMLP